MFRGATIETCGVMKRMSGFIDVVMMRYFQSRTGQIMQQEQLLTNGTESLSVG
jgi:hypothetical protein